MFAAIAPARRLLAIRPSSTVHRLGLLHRMDMRRTVLRRALAATTATLSLAGRIAGCIFHRARRLSGTAGRLMRSGMSRAAGLPATLALAAPGLLAVLAPCRRRPVKLRLCAAFGVFHVVFPSRRASSEICSRRSFDFCVAARISAPAEIAKFFFEPGFAAVSPFPGNTDFFQNSYLQSSGFWL